MTESDKNCIVEAIEKIDKRGKADRLFAYVLLIVVSFAVSVVGYTMTGLISSLSNNMQTISQDINSIHKEMVYIAKNIESMDKSIASIRSDIHSATGTHESIAQDVEELTGHIKKMHEDIEDMNKLNPIRKIF